MKKIFMIAIATMTAIAAFAQDHLEIKDFSIMPGESKTITLDLVSAKEEYVAFQCDIMLPEGLTINKNKRGAFLINFNAEEERADATSHTLSAAEQEDGTIRFLCYSTQNYTFLGTSGAIVDIPVTASSDMATGEYTIEIRNAMIAKDGHAENGSNVDLYVCKFTVGVPSGIESIDISSLSTRYNLVGQRVSNQAKGLLVAKGKKIVLK